MRVAIPPTVERMQSVARRSTHQSVCEKGRAPGDGAGLPVDRCGQNGAVFRIVLQVMDPCAQIDQRRKRRVGRNVVDLCAIDIDGALARIGSRKFRPARIMFDQSLIEDLGASQLQACANIDPRRRSQW